MAKKDVMDLLSDFYLRKVSKRDLVTCIFILSAIRPENSMGNILKVIRF